MHGRCVVLISYAATCMTTRRGVHQLRRAWAAPCSAALTKDPKSKVQSFETKVEVQRSSHVTVTRSLVIRVEKWMISDL